MGEVKSKDGTVFFSAKPKNDQDLAKRLAHKKLFVYNKSLPFLVRLSAWPSTAKIKGGEGGSPSFLHTIPPLKNNFSSDLSHFKIEIHFFIK